MNASTPYTDVNEAMLEIKRLREQLAAERTDRISWQELYEKTKDQLDAERSKVKEA